MAIIIAVMFEVMTDQRALGTQNCSKHLNGAVSVALVALKQKRQSDVTQKLLVTLVQSVLANSWVQGLHLPPNFAQLKTEVDKQVNPRSVHDRLLDIMAELDQFRQELQDKACSRPMETIERDLAIDESLIRLSRYCHITGICKVSRVSISTWSRWLTEDTIMVYLHG
jgi:hypothetical protein